jgi:hypothetical protein
MQLDGSPSWRLSLDDPEDAHTALFVRDAVGLVPPPSPEVPPKLAAEIPGHAAVLTNAERTEAGEQWLEWWRSLVAHQITPHPSPASAEYLDAYQLVMDPPDYESLAGFPALRTAAIATLGATRRWWHTTRRKAGPRLAVSAPVSDIAQEVIAEYGVSPDQLDAAVIVLAVTGAWSYVAGPGAVFCSTSMLNDPKNSRALLREAFVTSLDR